MSLNSFSFHRAEMLAIGFCLLTATPAVLAQETPQLCCQPQSGAMLPENDQQAEIDRDIQVTLRRNINVETQLSQLALTHSNNADIKKFSQQVLSENHMLVSMLPLPDFEDSSVPTRGARDVELASPKDDLTLSLQVPSQTQQAEKKMKKLYGPQFDQIYLVQMDAYSKNDLLAANRASAMTSLPDMREAGIREQTLVEEREAQISVLTAEEHFKIE